jgi:hypothetical protein
MVEGVGVPGRRGPFRRREQRTDPLKRCSR